MRLDRYTVGTYTPGASLLKQLAWYFIGDPLVRSSLLPFSSLKVGILRVFGARIGHHTRIKPGVKIKFPWRLIVGDWVWIGEETWIDNVALVKIGSHVCISQGVYLCTGNHNWTDPDFALIPSVIQIESGCWIGAKAIVGPGVTVRAGAVLGLGGVAGKSLDPMTIYTGNPAVAIKVRWVRDGGKGQPTP